MSAPCSLVWFRQDLRLRDNPALHAAAKAGRPVVCCYVLDDETAGRWKPGGAARWWLHHSLKTLCQALERKGAKLILRRGSAGREISKLAKEVQAATVYWNRCYEPFAVRLEKELGAALKKSGIHAESFNSGLLYEPWTVLTGDGEPYKVFSAFWRAARRSGDPEAPQDTPRFIPGPERQPKSGPLEDWALLPTAPDRAGGLRATWAPGEEGAARRLKHFLSQTVENYREQRDLPGADGTSALSPHLHLGEISPRTVWTAAVGDADFRTGRGKSVEKFLAELGWREFSYHLLYHFPDLPEKSLRPEFRKFPWKSDSRLFGAWTRGETGYPLVDAGMRQLWQIGWMHNRVRMNAASLLVKHLLQPWQDGACWFWDTLVDADLANNSASWQWVAGCGADAAPYFRVFNPMLQGERFDPQGDYVRSYVPELARLPDAYIHKPWEAPREVLDKAGVRMGKNYPYPVIEHRRGRQRALEAFEKIKGKAA